MNGSRLFGPVAGLLLVAVLVPPLKRFKKPRAHSKDKIRVSASLHATVKQPADQHRYRGFYPQYALAQMYSLAPCLLQFIHFVIGKTTFWANAQHRWAL